MTYPIPQKPNPKANGSLTMPQYHIADSMQFWRSVGHPHPRREQVAAAAGYKPGSGNFNNIVGRLVSAGYLSIPKQGSLELTANIGNPIETSEAERYFRSMMNGPQLKVIDALVAQDVDLSRDELAGCSGYQAGSGNFNNIVGSLTSISVIEIPQRGYVKLADWVREMLQ